MRVLTRSGEERILEYNNSLRTEGVNRPIIRGVSHDITERKRAEEALQQSHAQLAKKNRYETIISTVTQSVHKSINLQDVLENAVEAMSKNIDEADHVSIYLVEGEEAVLRAYRGSFEFLIERVRRIPYPRGFTWKTIIEGEPIYCPDVDEDTAIGPVGREIGTKSYVSMHIHYEGKTVGIININSLQRNAFNEEDLKLLEIVTQQIETAFNNARQAEALRKARNELEIRVKERTSKLMEVNEALRLEILERKSGEEKIKASLKERELLLKEIHHRVKNNLQVISALLRLQCGFTKDAETRKLFDETQNRIKSMSLIHEQLYRSIDLKRIDFTKYIRNLAYHLFRSYGVSSETLSLEIRGNNIKLNIDTAISCGLIINEVVSNSLKYAFPEDKKGRVYIDISSDAENKYTLIIGDNGIGLPNDIDFRNTETLGLQVVTTLVEQIEGTIELDRSNGTEFKIKFKEQNSARN
jgi:two-component sensor histidine kinase/putative methionine-R-sulfoxide reductase with GAF domain